MDRVLVLLICVGGLLPLTAGEVAAAPCDYWGTCTSATNDGDHTDVSGHRDDPGNGGGGGGGVGDSGPGNDGGGAGVGEVPGGDDGRHCLLPGWEEFPECVEEAPEVTLRDLAGFRPSTPVQRMQPNGWVVPGLEANFYAVTSAQTVAGTLLGHPADVHFTPRLYAWEYGDGTAATRSTRGDTWAHLGVPEFGATPTGHVYRLEGDYTVRLVVSYTAQYRYGGGAWTPVAGYVTVPANDLRISVTGAQTVLVAHDCRANPQGPGC